MMAEGRGRWAVSQELKFIRTNYRCPFYRGVPLIEVSIKRESTVPATLL